MLDSKKIREYSLASCAKYIKKELSDVISADNTPRFLSFSSLPTKYIIGIDRIEGKTDDHLNDISVSEKQNIHIFK